MFASLLQIQSKRGVIEQNVPTKIIAVHFMV